MKRLLIVDDSSYMRILLKKVIQKRGPHVILEAEDKQRAIELFNTVKPDIVTLDLNISGDKNEGIGLLTEIMKINPQVVVIIITATCDEDIKAECLKLGAKEYIKKPFDAEFLLNTIEKCS